MAAQLQEAFARREAQNEPTFVTFLTAGYPSISSTVPLLLAMERGGADVVELGVPFSDALVDGAAIQECNKIALEQGVDYATCLELVKQAREEGLKAPVILMGYMNPFHVYGASKAVLDAKSAGANGFIIVDLPPQDSGSFGQTCREEGMSLVPLIAPCTEDERVRYLAEQADSFLYVISRMAPTGASPTLPPCISQQLSRIRSCLPPNRSIPLAVGFGVSTRSHFTVLGTETEGVVMGSQLIAVIKQAMGSGEEEVEKAVEKFCWEVSGNRKRIAPLPWHASKAARNDEKSTSPAGDDEKTKVERTLPSPCSPSSSASTRFSEHGGVYIPEALHGALEDVSSVYAEIKDEEGFRGEWARALEEARDRVGMVELEIPSGVLQPRPQVWLKDGSVGVLSNLIGQCLLALRLGKHRVVTAVSSARQLQATAKICTRFGLEGTVFASEAALKQMNGVVSRIDKRIEVVALEGGYKDAISQSTRFWLSNLDSTHFLPQTAVGPAPFPEIVRDFQSVLGHEIENEVGRAPDAVVAFAGSGGASAVGASSPYLERPEVRLVAVEALGASVSSKPSSSAPLATGTPGIFHGCHTLIAQTSSGQILPSSPLAFASPSCTPRSPDADDYPVAPPQLAWLKEQGRIEVLAISDKEGREVEERWQGLAKSSSPRDRLLLAAASRTWEGLPHGANVVVVLSDI
ncbi:hypothetical protein JCM11641_007422 [Rhodosporidiobolus odoratus]